LDGAKTLRIFGVGQVCPKVGGKEKVLAWGKEWKKREGKGREGVRRLLQMRCTAELSLLIQVMYLSDGVMGIKSTKRTKFFSTIDSERHIVSL